MSGFVVVAHTDGEPVEAELLDRLTRRLAFRGPDGLRCRTIGPVGMGHALLATTPEAAREEQPVGADGDLWLVGDFRIDGRAALRAELGPELRSAVEPTDADLILAAYRKWGERCVEHLLGDFAFVIWDAPARKLFAARDHFGVKLLYFLHAGRTLVLSNTLQSLRAHPAMTSRLDEAAMGSLLLWGEHEDRVSTAFADVRSVPAAHALAWSPAGSEPVARRYWDVPVERPPLRYSDRRDYVDQFLHLLDLAVSDRLRTASVSVLMSGGIDSPMIAAAACGLLDGAGSPCRVTALTEVFDRLIPDQERRWSAAAASYLGIPIHHFAIDAPYESWEWLLDGAAAEPEILVSNFASRGTLHRAAANGRVVLTGFDGDRLLQLDLGALWWGRLRRGEAGSLARETVWHLTRARLPRVGLRAALRRKRERAAVDDGFPPWLAPDFAAKQRLRDRWREDALRPSPRTPRGGSYASLVSPSWRTVLDPMDAGMTEFPLEHRHPLIDLRLIEFALALPPTPWCIDKTLFRTAMRGRLPDALLRRPKEPAPGNVIAEGAKRAKGPLVHDLTPELGEYVDLARFTEVGASLAVDPSVADRLSYAALNTFALNGWLRSPMRTIP